MLVVRASALAEATVAHVARDGDTTVSCPAARLHERSEGAVRELAEFQFGDGGLAVLLSRPVAGEFALVMTHPDFHTFLAFSYRVAERDLHAFRVLSFMGCVKQALHWLTALRRRVDPLGTTFPENWTDEPPHTLN